MRLSLHRLKLAVLANEHVSKDAQEAESFGRKKMVHLFRSLECNRMDTHRRSSNKLFSLFLEK